MLSLFLHTFLFLSLGGGEILVIVLLILMLFGAKSIPDIARGLGKGVSEIKKATDDIKKEINIDKEVVETVKQAKRKIIESSEELKKDVLGSDIYQDAQKISKNMRKDK